MGNTDSHTPTTVKSQTHSSSRGHHPVISGAYSQFSKMDSDEVYAAAIQDLQEIFSLKVTHPSTLLYYKCFSIMQCIALILKSVCVYLIPLSTANNAIVCVCVCVCACVCVCMCYMY